MNIKKERSLYALILLGLVATCVSAYIRYGVPYLREQHLEDLDSQRVINLNSLNSTIQSILEINPHAILGNSETVYVSLPSASSTCGDLGLPTLSAGWSYHCVATSTLQNSDGSGWLPIDFNGYATTTTPAQLPSNSISESGTVLYDSFITNDDIKGFGTQYALTDVLSSQKYLEEYALNYGAYLTGNTTQLLGASKGIAGYWIASNEIIPSKDLSLYKRNVVIPTQLISCSGGCITNNQTDVAIVPLPNVIPHGDKAFSYGFFFKADQIPESNYTIFNPGESRLDVNIEGKTGALFVWYYDNQNNNYLIYKSAPGQYIDGDWHQVAVTKSGDSVLVALDGENIVEQSIDSDTNSSRATGFIAIPRGFSVRDVQIFQ